MEVSLASKARYAMLTVDTEALPKRASTDHVKRLMWCEHPKGRAGLREMCSIVDETGNKLIFFVDVCGCYDRKNEVVDVIKWLDDNGQDVQLHTHSEYLPSSFWSENNFQCRPRFMNQYSYDKAVFVISYFAKFMADVIKKPINAYRAGSFRWNAATLRALHTVGIPLSFNNSMSAYLSGQCTFSDATNLPFLWMNGVVEIPITERLFFPIFSKSWWGRFQFPTWGFLGNPLWKVYHPFSRDGKSSFLILLLHSWSLLYWDKHGYGVYKDDCRIESFRKLTRQIAKDYDIITSSDFLYLQSIGKIVPTHTIDVRIADSKCGTCN